MSDTREWKPGDSVVVERSEQIYASVKVTAVLLQKIPRWHLFDWIILDEEGEVSGISEADIISLEGEDA